MTGLTVRVVASRPDRYAATPTLLLRLRLDTSEDEPVHAMVLKAQIRIEPQRRRYGPDEEVRLVDLFGEPGRWGESLRPFLWAHATTTVAAFTHSTEIDLPVPCTYDFEVAAAKYLHALRDGEIPLVLLFNGTTFCQRDAGLVVRPIAWNVEAHHRLPVSVWRETMDAFFPDAGWIRLPQASIDALSRYRSDHALTSWEDTVERLLKEAGP
jgi:hypothetical protein